MSYNHIIDDVNHFNDPRVRAAREGDWYVDFDSAKMIAVFVRYDDKTGDETEESTPVRYEVCPTCGGHGCHVNPSIDSGGLGVGDFDDEDFREGYFSGAYDVTCAQCHGEKVVPVATDPEVVSYLDKLARERWAHDQERLSEIRMGC